MKQLHFFSLLALTLIVGTTQAQTNIDIGSGTSNSDNSPIQRNADYSASELVYLNSEINNFGTITGLGFYKANGSNTVTIDSVYIYLKTTTDTAVSTTTSTSGYTLVYQGPYPNTSTGYSSVTFNMVSNFAYTSNSGNLKVLVVRPYQLANTSRPYYRYTTFTGSARGSFFAKPYAWSDTATMGVNNWRPNIRLVMNISCAKPTSPNATNVTATTADLNWTQSGTPINYQIKYGPQGFSPFTSGTSVFTATKPYTLNAPLSPSTAYSYYVRAICSAGDTSGWSAVTNFTTTVTCPAPTALTSTGITKNAATFNWTNTGSPINFEIKYGAQGFNVNTAGTSVFTITKPYTLNPPLTPSTNYSYYVRSVCTPGDTSAWSAVNNFTTLCDYPMIQSATNGSACYGSTASLQATADVGGTIKWYDVLSGGLALGTGNNFVTPVLNATDTFYAESGQVTSAGSVGRSNYVANTATTAGSGGQGYRFNALKDVIIDSVSVWATTDTGSITIQLQTSTGAVLQTATGYISGTGATTTTPVKAYIPLNFSVATGTNYRLVAIGSTVAFIREQSGVTGYPFTIANVYSINANMVNGATNTNQCYFIYDTYISTGCVNPTRQPVIATVIPSPLNSLPDTSGTCNGIAATLNSGSANTTWTPTSGLYTDAGATTAYTGGALQTVYAKVTTPTTVYANTTSGSCTFNDSVFVDLQTGTAVDVTAATPSMNCGDAQAVSLTSNTPVSWSINGGSLYTDVKGTTAYTSGTAATSVYAKSNNNRYVTGYYEVGGCTFADLLL